MGAGSLRVVATVLLTFFVPLDFFAFWPIFHRHRSELGRIFAPGAAAVEAGGGVPVEDGPRCPACVVSALTAIESSSPAPSAPSIAKARFPVLPEPPFAFRRVAAVRGRAPPERFSDSLV